jgi:hypothetical protein
MRSTMGPFEARFFALPADGFAIEAVIAPLSQAEKRAPR